MIDYYLLGPIHELELPDRPRGSVASVCDFELSQKVLGHIVLSQWVNHKTLENIQFEVKYLLSMLCVIKHSLYLVSLRPVTRPILSTFFSPHLALKR